MAENTLEKVLDILIKDIHSTSQDKGWWDQSDLDEDLTHYLMMINTEMGEAVAEHRKEDWDKEMFGEEIADVLIRLLDLIGGIQAQYGLDITEIMLKKMAVNKDRPYKHAKRY